MLSVLSSLKASESARQNHPRRVLRCYLAYSCTISLIGIEASSLVFIVLGLVEEVGVLRSGLVDGERIVAVCAAG